MTRRALLLLPLAIALRADSARDAWDLLSAAASALSAGNAEAFLGCFDSRMPGFEELRAGVTALLREAEPRSSVELLTNEGDDRSRVVKVDWTLNVVSRQDGVGSTRREKTVTFRMEKRGRTWRITGMEPAGFFGP